MEILYGVWDVIKHFRKQRLRLFVHRRRIQKPHYDFGFFLVPLARYQKGI